MNAPASKSIPKTNQIIVLPQASSEEYFVKPIISQEAFLFAWERKLCWIKNKPTTILNKNGATKPKVRSDGNIVNIMLILA